MLTFGYQKFIILMTTKNQKRKGVHIFLVKMGRPTTDPKPYKVVARINETQKQILENYCKKNNCNQMEAIRRGIELLDK